MRRRWWFVAAALVVLVAGCSSGDDAASTTTLPTVAPTTSSSTSTSAAASSTAAAATPQGFEAIGVTIRDASNKTRDFCLWLAATPDERQQGLMQVTDLAGKPGMLFQFDADTQDQFWMFQTVMPLSIGFFAANGEFVSSADMAPCTGTSDTCPTYAAAGPYRDAIEVPQGTLGDLGIGPGSAIVARGSCPA